MNDDTWDYDITQPYFTPYKPIYNGHSGLNLIEFACSWLAVRRWLPRGWIINANQGRKWFQKHDNNKSQSRDTFDRGSKQRSPSTTVLDCSRPWQHCMSDMLLLATVPISALRSLPHDHWVNACTLRKNLMVCLSEFFRRYHWGQLCAYNIKLKDEE